MISKMFVWLIRCIILRVIKRTKGLKTASDINSVT